MSDLVRARVRAVIDLGHGLTTYERGLASAVSSARAELNRVGAELQLAVVDSQRRLHAAEQQAEMLRADLARCERGCEGLAAAARRAELVRQERERCLALNRQAEGRFARAASELLASLAAAEAAAAQRIPAGRGFIRDYAEILGEYLAKRGAA